MTFAKGDDLALEVGSGTELLVYRGEPQICDLVEILQRAQDRQSDLVSGDFRCAAGPDGVFDLLGEPPERVLVDRPPLARAAHTADYFVAAETLGHAVAFENGQQRGLQSGEPVSAVGALASTPNRLPFVDRPGVDYP
ncbi:hypothetical protein ABIE38_001017 [Dietzia sp. 2505]